MCAGKSEAGAQKGEGKMTKEEYLQALERELASIPDTERQDVLEYYREYFDEAGPENEEQVLRELGAPSALAEQIRGQCGFPETDRSGDGRAEAPFNSGFSEEGRQRASFSVEEFRNLKLSCDAGRVELVRSDYFGVSYDLGSEFVIKRLEVERDTLYVQIGVNLLQCFFGSALGRLGRRENYVKLFYPAGTAFEAFDLDLRSGSLTGGELSVERFCGRLASGRLEIDGLTGKEAAFTQSSGATRVSRVRADEIRLKTASGNMAAEDLSAAGTLCMQISSGNVEINDVKAGSLTGNTSSGRLLCKGMETDGLEFSVSSGYVELAGALRGENRLSVSSGRLFMRTSLPEEAYRFSARASSGCIRINGRPFKGAVDRPAENSLEASVSSGGIDVAFGG